MGPRPRVAIVGAGPAGAFAAAGLLAGKKIWTEPASSPPKFQRLTFRRGRIDNARFSSDGQTIVSPGYFIDRGHASIAARLTALGADIVEEELS